MALKALDIYKILPKKNCKECGDPTCLSFAMRLASGKGDISRCPYLSDEARQLLGATTRPPVRRIRIGVGERSFVIGEETVLFRHEKTFVHPPGLMVAVSDLMPPGRIREIVTRVRDTRLIRVGSELLLNGIAISGESGDPDRFRAAVAAVEGVQAHLPEVLITPDPAVMEAGLAVCGHFHPLIHAATRDNADPMIGLARQYGCPLVVRAEDERTAVEIVKRSNAAGAEILLLEYGDGMLSGYIGMATSARRQAIARSCPELGYPLFLDARRMADQDAAIAAGILKYAGVIVTGDLALPSQTAALTLRQNVYTDPQKPIQMSPGMYTIGEPGSMSPLLITVNFSLTYFTLAGYLEAARVSCHLLLIDTEGLSVLTAVAAGKFNENVVKRAIEETGIGDRLSHRTMVIPGYASPLSGRIEEATGWKILVGPRDAAEIGDFLATEWRA